MPYQTFLFPHRRTKTS
jgi:charged multivesicular body protein 5